MTSRSRRAGTSARRRAALAFQLSLLAGAAAVLFPSVAHAEDVPLTAGGGIYVSFTFGEELGVGYGAEAFFTGLATGSGSCNYEGAAGAGGLLQIGGINASTFRWVVAAHGGGQFGDEYSPALDGELGLAGHFSHGESNFGIHTGLLLQGPLVMDWFVRGEWLLDEYSVGVGARMVPTFGLPEGCIIGRPWRAASGTAPLGSALFGEREAVAHDDRAHFEDHAWLAKSWADDAQAEAASVPAFLQLAADLLAHDAPDDLIEAALSAAADEIRHARLCAAMASRWSGRRVVPSLPAVPVRMPLAGADGLARLALESWVDGGLGEGAAAARARTASERARDRGAVSVHKRIAFDETRHAELGWRVLSWAMENGDASIKDQVRATRDVVLASSQGEMPSQAIRHGRLSSAEVEAVHERFTVGARARLDRALVGASS